MNATKPMAELDPRYSSDNASPTPWSKASERLEEAEIYWISTVRPDGRPHVTPMIGLWLDGALIFSTGEDERKAKNLESNPHVVITTGCNSIAEGLDLIIEGDAVPVTDQSRLQRIAETFTSTYEGWHHYVQDGVFMVEGSSAPVLAFEVVPVKAFGFGKGDTFSQTRWQFQ
jgi:general stress protein 26